MALTKVKGSVWNASENDNYLNIVNVMDYGATANGVTDDSAAFTAALAAGNIVYVPAGSYVINSEVSITGDKTITGPEHSGKGNQFASINHTGGTNCFSATSAEFGSVCIRNLRIVGGTGTGVSGTNYAIRSSRPQSTFENIVIESYSGSGIELFEAGTGSQASWGTIISNIKYVSDDTVSAYRGIQLDINGGHVKVHDCEILRGDVGINIDKGEAISIERCNINRFESTYSSATAAAGQAAIRLSGADAKVAVTVRDCYLEANTTQIYVEKVGAMVIEGNYIADVGFGTSPSIYLKDSNVDNVTIRCNYFSDQSNKACISVDDNAGGGSSATNVEILNNSINGTNALAIGIYNASGASTYIRGNTINLTGGGGTLDISDPNSLVINMDKDHQRGYLDQNPAVSGTAYTLFTIGNNEVWEVVANQHDDDTRFTKAIVHKPNSGATAGVDTIVAGSGLAVSLSSNNVQLTQSTGADRRIIATWRRVQ